MKKRDTYWVMAEPIRFSLILPTYMRTLSSVMVLMSCLSTSIPSLTGQLRSRLVKLPCMFCTVAPRYESVMLTSAAVTPTHGLMGADTLYIRSSAWKTPVLLSRKGRL